MFHLCRFCWAAVCNSREHHTQTHFESRKEKVSKSEREREKVPVAVTVVASGSFFNSSSSNGQFERTLPGKFQQCITQCGLSGHGRSCRPPFVVVSQSVFTVLTVRLCVCLCVCVFGLDFHLLTFLLNFVPLFVVFSTFLYFCFHS